MHQKERGPVLTVFAVLFLLLAISNLLKPLQLGGAQTGFVFLGTRLDGTANLIAGPLFGLFLLAYAGSIYFLRRQALILGCVYAVYVTLNLVLFSWLTPVPDTIGYKLFGLVYTVVALGGSWGAVRALLEADLR